MFNKENYSEISENEYLRLIKEHNYENDIKIFISNELYLYDYNFNICIYYGSYSNKKNMDRFLKKLTNLKLNYMSLKDYSDNTINVNSFICENKCINDYGSYKCLKCNYYNNCMVEHEIDLFEKCHDENLESYYDMLENDFYR